ncbi:MAG: CDGSH iron-sulfur domain-containing protein [Planctomycetota bacterium]
MSDTDQPPTGASGGSKWAKDGCLTLRCRADGPLVVELPAGGPAPCFRVIDHEGGEFPLPAGKRAVALCRCGQSAQRPFCDGSHRAAGFRASELATGQ